jgi:hypothetical protein
VPVWRQEVRPWRQEVRCCRGRVRPWRRRVRPCAENRDPAAGKCDADASECDADADEYDPAPRSATLPRASATLPRAVRVIHRGVRVFYRLSHSILHQFDQVVAQGAQGRRLHIGARANLDVQIVKVIDGEGLVLAVSERGDPSCRSRRLCSSIISATLCTQCRRLHLEVPPSERVSALTPRAF